MSEPDILGITEWPGGLDDDLNVIERADARKAQDKDDLRQRIEQLLRARKYAYIRVFVEGNSTQDDRDLVMKDLANFGCKKRSTADIDTHIAARRDGRREVVLRIDDYIELTVEELTELTAPQLAEGEDAS